MTPKDAESLRRELIQKLDEFAVSGSFEGPSKASELSELVRQIRESESQGATRADSPPSPPAPRRPASPDVGQV